MSYLVYRQAKILADPISDVAAALHPAERQLHAEPKNDGMLWRSLRAAVYLPSSTRKQYTAVAKGMPSLFQWMAGLLQV